MAALKKCKACGGMIAKSATICPQCGNKIKRTSGCALFVLIVFILVILGIAASRAAGSGSNNTAAPGSGPDVAQAQDNKHPGNPVITSAVAYLKNVADICRVDIVGCDVFISFKNNTLPNDYTIIANAAASNGSRALVAANQTPSRCTVWVVPVDNQRGDVTGAYFTVTARKGKVQ